MREQATLGSFHRNEGDADSQTSTLWESLVLEEATLAAGFYVAYGFWAPLIEVGRRISREAKWGPLASGSDDSQASPLLSFRHQ